MPYFAFAGVAEQVGRPAGWVGIPVPGEYVLDGLRLGDEDGAGRSDAERGGTADLLPSPGRPVTAASADGERTRLVTVSMHRGTRVR
jgi:hypothetical protein